VPFIAVLLLRFGRTHILDWYSLRGLGHLLNDWHLAFIDLEVDDLVRFRLSPEPGSSDSKPLLETTPDGAGAGLREREEA
jgi:hypothetical protein